MNGAACPDAAAFRLFLSKPADLLLDLLHPALLLRAQGHAELSVPGRDPEISRPEPDARDSAQEHSVGPVPGQFFGAQDRPGNCSRRIPPLFRRARVGSPSLEPDPEAFRRRLGESLPKDDAPLRITAQVMESIDPADALLPQQIPAKYCPSPDLFARLEDQVDIGGCLCFVQFEGKPAQRRAVAVMPAFVGDARIPRMISERVVFRDRQRVHIRAEGDLPAAVRSFFQRIEPASPVDDLKAGVLDQEIPQPLRGLFFLHGELRMHVQFMAEICDLHKIVFLHAATSLLLDKPFDLRGQMARLPPGVQITSPIESANVLREPAVASRNR